MRKALISIVLAFVFYSMNADGTVQRWSFTNLTACNNAKAWVAGLSMNTHPAAGASCLTE